jgi:hypothetical protein
MDVGLKLDISISTVEKHIENIYSKIVYSDDDEFDSEPWPEKIIFVCKKGIDSYVIKYNALLHTFKHYNVPHYNRTHATLLLRLPTDPPSKTDRNGNELLIKSYEISLKS